MKYQDAVSLTGSRMLLPRLAAMLCAVGGLLAAPSAQAIPAFARSEGQDCTHCHAPYPKLNATGVFYKSNGFRFPDVEVTNVWDDTGGIPLSILVELEGFIDHTNPRSGKSTTEGPDGKVDELEVMIGGNLGSRVSIFAELEFDSGATPGYGPVWAQVNDLVGPMGAANLRVGQFGVDLPFLSEARRVIRNHYLAADKMGLLGDEFGVELNGQIGGDPSGGGSLTQYGVGLIRSGDQDKNHFQRGYGWISRTWSQVNHVGALLTGGQDFDGVDNFDAIGLGVGAQTECGPMTLTMGYFFDSRNYAASALSSDRKLHNVMAEALLMPDDRWVIGGRFDYLIETEQARSQDWGIRASLLARYNIVHNVWVGAEYRIDEGGAGSPLTGNDNVQKGRLFMFFAL